MDSDTKKIVLLGYINVGKSSLVRRFIYNKFTDEYTATIGVSINKKIVDVNPEFITLIIWDLEGHTTIADIPENYLTGTQGFIYVFDLSRKNTWENLTDHLKVLREKFPLTPIKVVGNKADLVDEKRIKEIRSALSDLNFIVSSAKTGDNVEKLFFEMAKAFVI